MPDLSDQHQRDLESGKFPKVGVNRQVMEEEEDHPVEFHPYNEEDARTQVTHLNRTKTERDAAATVKALARVAADAKAGVNLMPAIVEAVKAYASVGEITKEMVQAFGRFQEPIRF